MKVELDSKWVLGGAVALIFSMLGWFAVTLWAHDEDLEERVRQLELDNRTLAGTLSDVLEGR